MGMFDTSEETVPVTQEDFNVEPDKTGNAEQGAETTEPGAQETNAQKTDGQAPDDKGNAEEKLILGKYKTPDDLARAHEALQKRLGDMRNELGNLRKQVQPQEQGQQQQAKPQHTPSDWTEDQWKDYSDHMDRQYQKHGWKAVWDMITDVTRQMVTPLYETIDSQQLTQKNAMAVENELALLNAVDDDGNPIYPDAGKLTAEIDVFLQTHPYFNDLLISQHQNRQAGKISDAGVLEVLYKAVKAERVESLGKQAYTKGMQQGAAQAQAKAGAGLQKPGAKQTNTEPTPEEQIVNDIFAHKRGGFFI